MPEKTVHDQTQDKTVEPEKKEKPVGAHEPATEFKAKLNKYGFIHIPKKARPSLPFDQGAPLKAKIEGDALVIRRA